MTFIGFDIEGIDLYDCEDINALIASVVLDTVGIEIDNLVLFERFSSSNPRITHAIFTASISSGTPTKSFYNKLYWKKISDIDYELLDVFGLQVMTKLSECTYCHFIHQREEQLDTFFENFFNMQEHNLSILDVIGEETISPATYNLGVSMSDRTNEARQILRQQREGIKLLIMHAIEIRSAQYSNEAAN